METSQLHENELHLSSRLGDLEEVKRLVEEKQLNPLEKVGKYGRNALHYAAVGGHLCVMKYYTEERGYNPASQSDEGWNCLHYVAYFNHYDLVHYLIDKQKMDPMCQSNLGNTPLHKACAASVSVVTYLINAMNKYLPNEDVIRCKGQHGWAPLHFAAYYGKLEIVELLITNFNSNPHMTDDRGRTALYYAAQQNHLHTVKFLVEQKCNASHTDKDNLTPLHLASQRGHLDVVEYLTQEQ